MSRIRARLPQKLDTSVSFSYATPVDRLEGKVAVVTGAGRGFGLALAEALAEEKMRLVLADIDEAALESAVVSLRATGAEAIGVPTNVADAAAITALRDAAFERFDTVHVLCNNAATGGGGPLYEPIDVSVWERVFAVNLHAVLHALNAFLPRMLEQREGHVVNTASRQGLMPTPHLSAYSPAKAALINLSEMLRLELAALGASVGVTVLTPGPIRTEALVGSLDVFERGELDDPVMHEFLASRVAAAVEPIDLARVVVRAVRADALYVNSHRETLVWSKERVDRMAADADRLGWPGLESEARGREREMSLNVTGTTAEERHHDK
jgi:NAD(P)-dependent dehydrogenase (short-subunit alcohol dehydrogenase family)